MVVTTQKWSNSLIFIVYKTPYWSLKKIEIKRRGYSVAQLLIILPSIYTIYLPASQTLLFSWVQVQTQELNFGFGPKMNTNVDFNHPPPPKFFEDALGKLEACNFVSTLT